MAKSSRATLLDYTQALEWVEIVRGQEDYLAANDLFQNPSRRCKYCHKSMALEIDGETEGEWGNPLEEQVYNCCHCGWWYVTAEGMTFLEDDSSAQREVSYGILRKYDPAALQVPIGALRRELRKRHDLLHAIHPQKMEELAGSVLGEFLHCEVIHLGRTGDGGVDLLLINSEKEYVVQVKRRGAPIKAEGVSAIRELIGVMAVERRRGGIFVTTAPRFTKAGVQVTQKAVSQGVVEYLDLVDRKRFIEVLKLVPRTSEKPWNHYRRVVSDDDE